MTPSRLSAAARRRAVTTPPRRPLPWAFAVLALLGVLFLVLPTIGLAVRAPWSTLFSTLRDTGALTAVRLSLITATVATAVCFVLGVPIAWVLARARSRVVSVVRAFALLPLVLPPVGGGVALFTAYGRQGLVGQYLREWFGYTLPFTTPAVVVAETFVSLPFLVLTVEGALRGTGLGLEQAAATLGASRGFVLRHVTLPAIAPSLAAGAVLCWARALGEFGATIIFAGNFPGVTQTVPILVSIGLDTSVQQATALSILLVAVSLVILIGLRDRWLRPSPAA